MTRDVDSISAAFEQALKGICTNERVQRIEYGTNLDDSVAMWKEIDALGYTNALMPESDGGAGLTLAEGGRLMAVAAQVGVPHSFGSTMIARALAAGEQIDVGTGCVAMAYSHVATDGTIRCTDVSGAQLAEYVLTQIEEELLLLPVSAASLQDGNYRPRVSASLHWKSEREAVSRWKIRTDSMTEYCNAIDAVVMASTMERILDLTIEYVSQRHQFGRPISRFQAIQHDLAIMAEHTFSASFAARMATCSATLRPEPLLALSAKLRASEAATIVAALAHSSFGAIGITEEHILGVFTARLHEWRSTADTELRCAARLGAAVLGADERFSDFVRKSLTPIVMSSL